MAASGYVPGRVGLTDALGYVEPSGRSVAETLARSYGPAQQKAVR